MATVPASGLCSQALAIERFILCTHCTVTCCHSTDIRLSAGYVYIHNVHVVMRPHSALGHEVQVYNIICEIKYTCRTLHFLANTLQQSRKKDSMKHLILIQTHTWCLLTWLLFAEAVLTQHPLPCTCTSKQNCNTLR